MMKNTNIGSIDSRNVPRGVRLDQKKPVHNKIDQAIALGMIAGIGYGVPALVNSDIGDNVPKPPAEAVKTIDETNRQNEAFAAQQYGRELAANPADEIVAIEPTTTTHPPAEG